MGKALQRLLRRLHSIVCIPRRTPPARRYAHGVWSFSDMEQPDRVPPHCAHRPDLERRQSKPSQVTMSCQLATYLESNALGLVPGEPSPNYSWDQKEPTYENLPEYRRMTKASHTASRRLVRIVVPPPSRMSFASEQLFA